jgi:hypothetical protein
MVKVKSRFLIIFLSLLILLQFFYLNFRLNKLEKTSSEYLKTVAEKEVRDRLANVPEPDFNIPASGAKLYFKPKQASFSDSFSLEVWVDSKEPLREAQLRLFYPPDKLQVTDLDWQADKNLGQATWSTQLNKIKEGNFLLTTISFITLDSGDVSVSFDFSQGSKLDCNLFNIEKKDVLEEAVDGNYTIY